MCMHVCAYAPKIKQRDSQIVSQLVLSPSMGFRCKVVLKKPAGKNKSAKIILHKRDSETSMASVASSQHYCVYGTTKHSDTVALRCKGCGERFLRGSSFLDLQECQFCKSVRFEECESDPQEMSSSHD